ncbi:MAG: penicillin-binding protein activator [Pseudomonadota bacterium]
MVRRWIKKTLLASLLCGLCASTLANTTAADPATEAGSKLDGKADATQTVPPPATPDKNAPPAPPSTMRLALLLPLSSDTLGQAANTIRAGFMAAYERESSGVTVAVIDSGESGADVLNRYLDAHADNDVIVGPLSRAGVTAVAQSGSVNKPTIALNQPETAGPDEVLPRKMLVMSLSIEEEARQMAVWAAAHRSSTSAFVVSSSTPWQRRAAKAFVAQWQQTGRSVASVELPASAGYLSASALVQLRTQIEIEKPGLLFVALDADQTRQARTALGYELPIYGTSQLNPTPLSEQIGAAPVPELKGVRLLDMPWLLQADHTAVMVYPHLVTPADQKASADLERLYALGIDAYRVARELAGNKTNFEIDGVTGKLTVRFGKGPAFFERIEQQAVYMDGVLAPLNGRR